MTHAAIHCSRTVSCRKKKNILVEFSDYDNWTDISRVLNFEENHFANTLLIFIVVALPYILCLFIFLFFGFVLLLLFAGNAIISALLALILFFALFGFRRMNRAVKEIYWLVRRCYEISTDMKNEQARLKPRLELVPTLCQKCNKKLVAIFLLLQ